MENNYTQNEDSLNTSQTIENQNHNPNRGNTIYVNQVDNHSNGIGTTGFILSIVAIFLGWIPFLGWVIWLLGLVFSAIGVFRQPKGLSIAGLIISLIGVIILIFLGAFFTAAILSSSAIHSLK